MGTSTSHPSTSTSTSTQKMYLSTSTSTKYPISDTLYSPPSQKNPKCLPYRVLQTIYLCALFSPHFWLQFWVGVANPQYWGKVGGRGSGMVPFKRALVSSYRPSIVTFPLSLRVSEILRLLFPSTPLFPYPTFSFSQISPCSLGIGGSPFRYKERRCWANCLCN